MIKHLETGDIAGILRLDHDVDEILKCDRGEWVQFLMKRVDDPNFFIVGDVDGIIKGYIVALYNPFFLSRNVSVIYSMTAGLEANREILEMLKEWGRGQGARAIEFVTTNVAGHMVYGFEKKATLMTMEL